ncbi:two-component sensor histidine kinase, partial [Nitratireductor aquimarinus]
CSSDLGDTQAVASVLDELVAQARRGADILSHLRQWIRPPRGETGMTDLNAAIGGVEALLAPEARKRSVKLKLDLADEALAVRADRTELEQVIFNLVRNAFEALEETQDGQVSVTSRREAGLAILDVYDNGPGVDEALAGQVFEPFVTGKEQGTGLGLSLSQRIVERMNGEIELLPSQGGARFHVRLPLASQRHEIKHDDGRVSA